MWRLFTGLAWVLLLPGLLCFGVAAGSGMLGCWLRRNRMRDWLAKVVGFFSTTNEMTWIGHAVQGLVFGALGAFGVWLELPWYLGVVFTVGAFSHRELDNALGPLLADGFAAAWASLRRDGLMDFFAPYIASVAGAMLVLLLLGEL